VNNPAFLFLLLQECSRGFHWGFSRFDPVHRADASHPMLERSVNMPFPALVLLITPATFARLRVYFIFFFVNHFSVETKLGVLIWAF
jgi:hypothetical protein